MIVVVQGAVHCSILQTYRLNEYSGVSGHKLDLVLFPIESLVPR